jgi:hypothetical protein
MKSLCQPYQSDMAMGMVDTAADTATDVGRDYY